MKPATRALSSAYTEAEIKALRKLYPRAASEVVLAALQPGRSWYGVQHQARKLKVARLEKGKSGAGIPWSAEHLAILREQYPTKGAVYVGKLVGRRPSAVAMQASALQISRQRPISTIATPPAHSEIPKAKNTLKPIQVSVPRAASSPVKRSPSTPNLNARVEARLRQGAKAKATSIIDEIKSLPADSEGRRVYARAAQHGGPAATAAFLNWKQQQTH